jgi:hypothetical protein
MKKYLVCFWITGETMPRNEEITIPKFFQEKYITLEILKELKLKFWTSPIILINYWEIL